MLGSFFRESTRLSGEIFNILEAPILILVLKISWQNAALWNASTYHRFVDIIIK